MGTERPIQQVKIVAVCHHWHLECNYQTNIKLHRSKHFWYATQFQVYAAGAHPERCTRKFHTIDTQFSLKLAITVTRPQKAHCTTGVSGPLLLKRLLHFLHYGFTVLLVLWKTVTLRPPQVQQQ